MSRFDTHDFSFLRVFYFSIFFFPRFFFVLSLIFRRFGSRLYHLSPDDGGWGTPDGNKWGYGVIKGSDFFRSCSFAEANNVSKSSPRTNFRAMQSSQQCARFSFLALRCNLRGVAGCCEQQAHGVEHAS